MFSYTIEFIEHVTCIVLHIYDVVVDLNHANSSMLYLYHLYLSNAFDVNWLDKIHSEKDKKYTVVYKILISHIVSKL